MEEAGIIGAGAWGTALAQILAQNGRRVRIWAREAHVVEAINRDHANPRFLPGVPLEPAIEATGDLKEAAAAEVLLLVVPAQYLRTVLERMKADIGKKVSLVIAAKGIERKSQRLMSEVVAETVPHAPLAVLSGPTFAAEVAHGLPTAVTLACAELALGRRLVAFLGSPTFRPYLTDDVIGAQTGGAVKNVLAIACGIATGRGLGENARAALITRGFAEIARLGHALGARDATLTGLSGLGDLVLTCGATQSRNFSLGQALGKGESLKNILAARDSVAEGVATAPAVAALARQREVEMPIVEATSRILHEDASIDESIKALLARPFTAETGFALDRGQARD
ncbi:MAG: NAD(P)H-dependent glycerol-3-phosphate dehydrogenase [Alphaproteobacteria bacterium]